MSSVLAMMSVHAISEGCFGLVPGFSQGLGQSVKGRHPAAHLAEPALKFYIRRNVLLV